jgi:magnesium-transporting ATPase (P-type)
MGQDVEKLVKRVGTCEFTSDRRLSSNIYKRSDTWEEENDQYPIEDYPYVIYSKGADSSVKPILKNYALNILNERGIDTARLLEF